MLIFGFVTFTELLIYQTVIMILAGRIFGAKANVLYLVFSYILLSLTAFLIELLSGEDLFKVLFPVCPLITIISLRLSFSGLRWRTVISTYLTLFMVCLIATSSALMVFPDERELELLIELLVHLVMLVLCIVICCTNLRVNIKYIYDWTPLSTKRILLLLLLCNTFLSLAIQRLSFYNSPALLNGTKFVFMLLILTHGMVVSGLLVYSVTNKRVKKDAANYEKQLLIQSEYYKKLSESNFAVRQYRHDSNNIYICLEKLIEEGRTDEALDIVRKQRNVLTTPKKGYDTGNGIADGLITDKSEKAKKLNTEIIFEGALPAQSVLPTDLCVIFGNTLDNAIEACAEIEPEQNKVIHISSQCNSGYLFIEITNPVAHKVKIENGFPFTTKADKQEHGFGLYSLATVVKNYHGTMKCECDDKTFRIFITLELKQNSVHK